MIFAWMNARVDVDIKREREREKGREGEREIKERQIAKYFFSLGIETEGVFARSPSFSLFLSVFLSTLFSLSLCLIYLVSLLLKRQKFLIELLFFAGDFLELHRKKRGEKSNFFSKKKKIKRTLQPTEHASWILYIVSFLATFT